MVKWITKACEPSQLNLHVMLRFRPSNFQPYSGGRWQPSMEYFTITRFQAKQGSKIWNRACEAWRCFVSHTQMIPPSVHEELLCEPFWWSEFSSQIGPSFSRLRAAQLHRSGMRVIRDARNGDQFLLSNEASDRFGLRKDKSGAWEASIRALTRIWGSLLDPTPHPLSPGEWVGYFLSHWANQTLSTLPLLSQNLIMVAGLILEGTHAAGYLVLVEI